MIIGKENHFKKAIMLFLAFSLIILVIFCVLIFKEKSKIVTFNPTDCEKNKNIQVKIESIQDSDFFIISGYAYVEGEKIDIVDGSVVLYQMNTDKYYKLPTQLVSRPDLTESINDGVDYSNSGFIARVSKSKLDFNNLGYEICYYYNHDSYNAFVHSGNYMGNVSEDKNE
jgi:hypothetical protein